MRAIAPRLIAVLIPVLACATGEPPQSSSASASVGVSGIVPEGSSSGEPGTGDTSGGPIEDTGDEEMTTAVPTTGEPTTGEPLTDPTTVEPMTSTSQTGTTGADCGPCDAPPGPCHAPVGECVAGECAYMFADAGQACDDGDACTESDACDGAGACQGAALVCEAEHASGGSCQDGVCGGFTCTPPWADCDGDWANGCEVPVGVANQCDAGGLNPDGGCWTAYCGALADPKAKNFGSFYCYDCSTCNTPAPGMWQWCNHSTGTWFEPAAGACGANEDLVCAPP